MTSAAAFLETRRSDPRPVLRDLSGKRIHMIGIGGSGMSGLAGVLLRQGAQLSGTDQCASEVLRELARRGATISTASAPDDLPLDTELVVASAAVANDHSQVRQAVQRGIAIYKYAEMLGSLMTAKKGIAVAGTHGKSTTTAWVAFVLQNAGLDPSFVVGASADQLGGGSGAGAGDYFVVEACEFDRSFLNLHPTCAAILNIDADHLDYYGSMSHVEQAFRQFAALVPAGGLLVVNGDDERCRSIVGAAPVQTCGLRDDCDWRAADVRADRGLYSFDVLHRGRPLGRVRLGVAGRHNIGNALTVIALSHWCGAGWGDIVRGLAEFRGAARRMTLRGEAAGVRVVDDYGHHPTEIRATLSALRERFEPTRLRCVFQPHQHSRTRLLFDQFAESLTLADDVILPDIYAARDADEDRAAVSGQRLAAAVCERGGRARYIPSFDRIVSCLSDEAARGDLVVTMGAGDIWKVSYALLDRLRGHLPT